MSLMDMLVAGRRNRAGQQAGGNPTTQAAADPNPGNPPLPNPVQGPSIPMDPAQGTQPPAQEGGPAYPGPPWSPVGVGDHQGSYAPVIDEQISQHLLGQDPFPQELVPPFMIRQSGIGADGGFSFERANLDFNEYDATTREVQDEELTSHQLNQLLASDSDYIQNARRRGIESAASRGGLSSSIYAGAAERSAIEAGLPIASQDAQAYIQAASENLQWVNQNTMTKMNAAANMAITNAQNSGQVAAARIAADSRERISELQLNAQYAMQQGQFSHQINLAELGFDHDMNLMDLSHAQRLEIEELYGQPRFEAELQFQQAGMQAQLVTTAMSNYASMINNMNGLDIDDAARQRGYQFAQDYLTSMLQLVESIGNTNEWPDFDFDFGGGDDG